MKEKVTYEREVASRGVNVTDIIRPYSNLICLKKMKFDVYRFWVLIIRFISDLYMYPYFQSWIFNI